MLVNGLQISKIQTIYHVSPNQVDKSTVRNLSKSYPRLNQISSKIGSNPAEGLQLQHSELYFCNLVNGLVKSQLRLCHGQQI